MTPKIIAHRGASAHAPENTMAAFQLALDHKADGIELDVMLSKDGQVVVIHDDSIDRTTQGHGRVRDMTLEELKTLDAGNGERIPTLKEVLESFGGQFMINIELKNYSSILDRLPIEVAKLVQSYKMTSSVLISSFNPINLPRFRRQAPEVELGLLTMPGKATRWAHRLFKYDALHPHYKDVDEELVTTLHAQKLKVNVWTPDEACEIQRMADLHVDAIITNYPRRAREVLEL